MLSPSPEAPEPLSLANKQIKTPRKKTKHLSCLSQEKSDYKSNKHIIVYTKRHHACTNKSSAITNYMCNHNRRKEIQVNKEGTNTDLSLCPKTSITM